jgi:L-malate glycosyltransferase
VTSAVTSIHQFAPAIRPADATSAHALHVRELLRDLGFDSQIYVEDDAPLVEGAVHIGRWRPSPGSIALYQFAIGSVLTDALLRSKVPLALNFHNLTPAAYFDPWAPGIATSLRWSMAQLRFMAPQVLLGICVSRYNAVELERVGARETIVAPILLRDEVAPESTHRAAAVPAGARWLFVGRLAPNKAQHDVISAFALYTRVYDPAATLCLVGGAATPRYEQALRSLARALGVADAVEFAGSVSDTELATHYDQADVFVCLSDHEGYCVPLVEAMRHSLPVVAFGSSAVPETLGGAGLCLPEKSPALVATAVRRVCEDVDLRARMVDAGGRRLVQLGPSAVRPTWQAAIERFVELATDAGPSVRH